jgi:hypothetical protein
MKILVTPSPRALGLALGVFASVAPLHSAILSIDFQGGRGSVMGQEESAGVVPATHWNLAAGANGTLGGLTLSGGATSGVGATWSSAGVWQTPIADNPGDFRMMKGFVEAHPGNDITLNFTGLAGTYDVYLYFDGDNSGNWRLFDFYVNGSTTPLNAEDKDGYNFGGTFLEAPGNQIGFAMNYLRLSSLSGTSLSIVVRAGPAMDYQRGVLNGVQIVGSAIPEPSSAAGLAGLAALGLVATRRGRRL